MTDGVEPIERELAMAIAAAAAAIGAAQAALDRLRGPLNAKVAAQTTERYIDAAGAFHVAGFVSFDDDKIQRICRNHAGELTKKLGRWHVIEPQFSEFVEKVKRGEANFRF